MKKVYLTLLGIILSSTIAFASVANDLNSEPVAFKIENLNSKEKIEMLFSNETEFYSYLKKSPTFFTLEEGDQCSAKVTITVGVASSEFSMSGDCDGFADRFAQRVKETKASLQKNLEETSWWNNWF